MVMCDEEDKHLTFTFITLFCTDVLVPCLGCTDVPDALPGLLRGLLGSIRGHGLQAAVGSWGPDAGPGVHRAERHSGPCSLGVHIDPP